MALIPITKVFPCSLPWRVCFYSWMRIRAATPWKVGAELLSLLLVPRQELLFLLLVPRHRAPVTSPGPQSQSSCPFSWSPGTELLSLLLVPRYRAPVPSPGPQVWILSLLLVPRRGAPIPLLVPTSLLSCRGTLKSTSLNPSCRARVGLSVIYKHLPHGDSYQIMSQIEILRLWIQRSKISISITEHTAVPWGSTYCLHEYLMFYDFGESKIS